MCPSGDAAEARKKTRVSGVMIALLKSIQSVPGYGSHRQNLKAGRFSCPQRSDPKCARTSCPFEDEQAGVAEAQASCKDAANLLLRRIHGPICLRWRPGAEAATGARGRRRRRTAEALQRSDWGSLGCVGLLHHGFAGWWLRRDCKFRLASTHPVCTPCPSWRKVAGLVKLPHCVALSGSAGRGLR